jgi:hypothetical protein
MKLLKPILLLCLFLPVLLIAEDSHTVIVDAPVETDFKPEAVLFLARINGQQVKLQYALVLEEGEPGSFSYHAGTVFNSEEPVERLQFSMFVHGKGSQFWIKHFPEETLTAEHPRMLSVDGMRKQVLNAKDLQKQWETKLVNDRETLRRLRKDAEIIGNLGRITRLFEQVELLKEE